MLRLLNRGRKADASGEDEPKKYKKANLGESNKMYFHEELKMWVEKGKEQEARAEAEKLRAPPPPVVAAMTPASSSTSLTGDAASAGPPPPAPSFTRNQSKRYLATPGLNFKSGSAAGTSSGPPSGTNLMPSSGPASGSGLVPGMPNVPGVSISGAVKVPGLPSAPGKPAFFMPTPTASDMAIDAAGDETSSSVAAMSNFQSGVDMDAVAQGNGQPNFFVPAATAFSSAGGSGSSGGTSAAGAHCHVAAAAADAAMSEAAELLATAVDNEIGSKNSSTGGKPPVLAGNGNLSFAMWQPGQQQHEQQFHPGASGNGNLSSYAEHSNPAASETDAVEPPTGAVQSLEHSYGSSAWPPVTADGYKEAGAMTAADEEGASGDVYNWGAQSGATPGVPQDPFGPPQDPLAVLAPLAESAVFADTAAVASGTADGAERQASEAATAADAEATAGAAAAAATAADEYSAEGYDQYQYWYQQGYVWNSNKGEWEYYGQPVDSYSQSAAGEGDAGTQQQYTQPNGYSNGGAYDYGTYGGQAQHTQQPAETVCAEAPVQYDSAAGFVEQPASVAAEIQQGFEQQPHQGMQQQAAVLLEPVHPELPGISTTVQSKGSDDFAQLAAVQRLQGSARAAGRHQTMPGSAPHAAGGRAGSPTSSGGFLTSPPARSASMHAGGVSSLLPQPRASFNGSTGPLLCAESSALTVPPTAVAGDASMLTTVRPSSPYARPISPLARSNTGMSDSSSASKGAAQQQGFPIPSPPLQVFGKPSTFVPGPSAEQQQKQHQVASEAGPVPWQPSAQGGTAMAAGYVGSAGQHMQQQAGASGAMLLNGYIGPSAAGNGAAPWGSSTGQQRHGVQNDVAAGNGSSQQSSGAVPFGSVPGTSGPAMSAEQHVHPYDVLVNTELKNVNWKAQHFKQPGKLNKLVPHEKFEMEQAQKQEAEQRLTGSTAKKKDAFWYKQMEYRKKLPAGAMKPSASEPTHMPSYHPAGRVPSPIDSNVSNASYYPDWQQHQQVVVAAAVAPASPATPARAVTAQAAFAVAGSSPGDEPTPTSKYVPHTAVKDGATPVQMPQPEQQLEQQQCSDGGVLTSNQQVAANATSWQPEQQEDSQYEIHYEANGKQVAQGNGQYQANWPYYQGYEGQHYQQSYEQQQVSQGFQQQPNEQQGYASNHQQLDHQQAWHQDMQRVVGEEQQQYGQQEEPTNGQQPQQQGAPEMEQQQPQQQQQQHSWGSELEQVMPDGAQQQQQTPEHPDAAGAAWGSDGGASGRLIDAAHSIPHHQEDWERRVSKSSTVASSQPSTATAAAAAANHIVSTALENICREHEEAAVFAGYADQSAVAAVGDGEVGTTAADGWEGLELADGWVGGEELAVASADTTAAIAAGVHQAEDGHIAVEAPEAAADELADGWECDEALVMQAEGSSTADAVAGYAQVISYNQQQQSATLCDTEVGVEAAEAAGPAVADYPPQWLKMRDRLSAAPLDGEMIAHRDTFFQWGDFVFASLPDVASWHAEAAEQEQAAEQLDDVFQKYGETEMKGALMESAFLQGGLDLEAIMSTLQDLEVDDAAALL